MRYEKLEAHVHTHLKNQTWGVNDGEVGAVGILGPHDDGLGRDGGLDLLEIRLRALLNDVSDFRGHHHWAPILLRVLLLPRTRRRQPTSVS